MDDDTDDVNLSYVLKCWLFSLLLSYNFYNKCSIKFPVYVDEIVLPTFNVNVENPTLHLVEKCKINKSKKLYVG